MRQAHGVSWQEERQREALRRNQREYMRRWRANPENHERVVAMRQRQNAKRKIERSRDTGEKMCAFCQRHAAVKQVERMITTTAGFKSVFVGCCVNCLA